jgi:HTH-type transcriptional regulator/antitoxin HigA
MGNTVKPFLNISTGDMIRRELEFLGWTQEDLAQVTNISRKTLSNIMNAKQKLQMEHARALAEALGGSAESWMHIDTRYWLNATGQSVGPSQTERKARIRKYIPVLEMQRKGWYNEGKSADTYESTYREIWGEEDPDITFSVYETYGKCAGYCAGRSHVDNTYTENYSITWYQIAKRRCKEIQLPPYSSEKLKYLSKNLLQYTAREGGVIDVIHDLNEAGVIFLVQSHLSKTSLDGASFFCNDHPVIVYTARYDRIDNFWFTLAHEIAHLLLHFKQSIEGIFLDDLMDKTERSTLEQEADAKAEEILRVKQILASVEPFRNYISEAKLVQIASEIGIEVSLLLGILQIYGYVDYRKLNKFKKQVKVLFPRHIVM